ncbi:MAG: phage holin family protein [Rhodothalassiaceae bacterium]
MTPADDRPAVDATTDGTHSGAQTRTSPSNKSTPELARTILDDVTRLVQNEGELARAEIQRGVRSVVAALLSFAAGLGLLVAGLTMLLFAIAGWLAAGLELNSGTASIIAAAIGLLIGFFLLSRARDRMDPKKLTPSRTAQEVQKDAQTVRRHS